MKNLRVGLLAQDDVPLMRYLASRDRRIDRFGVMWDAFQIRWFPSHNSESLPIEFFNLVDLRRALMIAEE